jgi:tight adherence protein C
MSTIPVCAAVAVVLIVGGLMQSRLVVGRVADSVSDRSEPRRQARSGGRGRRVGWVVPAIATLLVDPVLLLGVGVVVVVALPRLRRIADDRKRRGAVTRSVPDAIELLILMMRAGLTPRQAIEASVAQAPEPIRPGFVEVERRLHRGEALADALRGLPETSGPSLDSVADTLAISVRHGTPIGDALTQLSVEVSQQRRRAAEADARKLPVRLSFPLVFCTLPSFVLVAIAPAVLAALSSLGDSTW